MQHTSILTGDKVTLRPTTEEDVPLLARWLFAPEVNRWLQLSEDPPEFRTVEAVRERYERMQADPYTQTWRIDAEDIGPVGQIELVSIHPLQKRAEVHLSIGEAEARGQGIGRKAVRRVLEHAFGTLGLRRIWTVCDADNVPVLRCLEACGFVREGLLRQHRLRHGQPTDMVAMGAVRETTTP